MNIQNIFKPTIIILALAISCAPGIHRSSVEKDSRTTSEDRFDPLAFPGDDAVITGKYKISSSAQTPQSESSRVQTNDTIPIYETGADTSGPEQQVEVFRVQVFASKSFDEAQQFSADIAGLFPEGVFVEYQMPYYKVRVGEFFTPKEGEAFLDVVRRMGFKNAWLVRVIK